MISYLHHMKYCLIVPISAIITLVAGLPILDSNIMFKIERQEIRFLLFTRYSGGKPMFLVPGEILSLTRSPFEPGDPTKIIIHGFQNSCADKIFTKIKTAYLETSVYNIICVDWSFFAKDSYWEAIDRVRPVGLALGLLLDWLVLTAGVELEEVHIIGHSLGAHVAGVAAFNTQLGNVGRITGLDPAVPLITFDPEKTLDISDALLVEIVFTSILSYGHPLGHINYYLNGGLGQPDCVFPNNDNDRERVKREIFGSGEIICSHSRAYEVFSEAILCTRCFPATLCYNVTSAMNNSCEDDFRENYIMLNLDFMTHGIYNVKTI